MCRWSIYFYHFIYGNRLFSFFSDMMLLCASTTSFFLTRSPLFPFQFFPSSYSRMNIGSLSSVPEKYLKCTIPQTWKPLFFGNGEKYSTMKWIGFIKSDLYGFINHKPETTCLSSSVVVADVVVAEDGMSFKPWPLFT